MDENPYIKFRNIYVIPTFHSRIEFAKLVRTALFKVFPDVIAVELPNEEFFLGISKADYKITKTINLDKNEISPINIKTPKRDRISADDRKAYEEYFGKSEDSGY